MNKFSKLITQSAFSCIGLTLVASSQAQLLNHKDMTSSIAMTMAQTAIATCKSNGYAVSVSIVGRSGELITQVRGDDTGPHTVENSFRKAYTARTFKVASGEIVTRLKNDPAFALIHLSNVIANQGGLPIKFGDETIGGIGISGAPGGDKDEACAKAALDKVADQLK